MKNRILWIIMVAIAVLGCSKTHQDEQCAVQLTMRVGSIETRAALNGVVFPHESQINVCMVDQDGGNTNHDKMTPYIYKNPTGTAGVWMPVNIDNALVATNNSAQLLAHYPAILPAGSVLSTDKRTLTPELTTTSDMGDLSGGTYNGENSFFLTIQADQPQQEVFLAASEVDYMIGATATPCNSTNPEAQITVKHALCMVVFHIYKDPNNTNPGAVTAIDIQNINGTTGPLCKGSFLISNCAFTASDRTNYRRTMLNFPDGSYYGMMVYPTTIADGSSVRAVFTVDGVENELMLPAKEWQSGSIMLYNIKLKATSAELEKEVGLVDWATGTSYDFDIK